MATQAPELTCTVRDVTDDEVAHFQENGWVKLEGLVTADVATAMREYAKELVRKEIAEHTGHEATETGQLKDLGWALKYPYVARDEQREPFRSVVWSLGPNARRFFDREVAARYWADLVAPKMASGSAGSGNTAWHQDLPATPFDRTGLHTYWIALDEVTPDMGTMRFLSGSQREGSLGHPSASGGFSGDGAMDTHAYLFDRYELSPPLTLKAGDATVHHGLVLHGAPENVTDRHRWVYISAVAPADALNLGVPSNYTNGLDLEPLKPLDHPSFPVLP